MAQSGRSWLSRRAQELVVRSVESKAAGEPFDCDLLIVGSGYGGAVAAARASGHSVRDPDGTVRPARVWVLERGNEYLPGMFPSRFSEIAGHVRFDMQDGRPARGVAEGLFDARLGSDVCVLLGSGLGGGSLINAGVMAEPEPAVFESGWPSAITRAALEDGYTAAHNMLSPKPVPEDKKCDKLRSFIRVAPQDTVKEAPVTVHWEDERNAAGVQMKGCTLCGDCLTGCNQSAKGSVDTNYLAFARSRGVEMYCGGTVDTLARDATDSHWEVRWRYTEPALRPADGKPFIVRAKRVVLAAGSLGSTEILLRSRSRSLELSEKLGKGFSVNGGRIAAGINHTEPVHAVGDQESDPADLGARRVGPTITGLVRVPPRTTEDGPAPGFVIEEFSVPAGLRHVYGEVAALLATLSFIPIGTTDPCAVADGEIERIGLYGLTGDDGAGGHLQFRTITSSKGTSDGVGIEWPEVKVLPLYGHMQKWLLDRLNKVGASLVPHLVAQIGEKLPAVTVHPLGGCSMGMDAVAGVVDDCGRVFVGMRARADLIVLDGSIVPRALGINPAYTITALAERAIDVLLREWGWIDGGRSGAITERPQGRRRELPANDVVWSIRERLQGRFSLDQKKFFWARMEIEFEEIPGFRRALALQSRVVAVRRAVLELYPARDKDDEFTVSEPSADEAPDDPICRAELSGSVSLFEPMADAPRDDPRVTLNYRLSVQSIQGDAPLAVGGRLTGLKVLDANPENKISPWRELTEMDVSYDGNFAGRWALDLEDLARRRDPLLRITRLSSMPDALDDLAAIALYVLRRVSVRLLVAMKSADEKEPAAPHLDKRWPQALGGVDPEITPLSSRAQVARYPASRSRKPVAQLPPVLLVHGLGSSGASFTDESMPESLAATLIAAGREVWVLDVRSSIGNEYARHKPDYEDALRWSVESVARADLPAAVDVVHQAAGGKPIDVLAHCMGAVMFCLAALGDDKDRMKGKLRAVVLSQVGPLIRLSPFNRLRGYVASYLQQFLRIETFDTCPHFSSRIENDDKIKWEGPNKLGFAQLLADGLLSMFPYPDDDDEAGREAANEELKKTDFRRIRHRGDAIFGQMFELENVSDDVLKRLEVLMGWVMVPMLSQAIHFARRNMITDASGGNAVMHAKNFKQLFGFPLLIIHGRRNRVFNWRGSHDSWRMLKKLRDETIGPPQALPNGQGTLHGANTPTQLAVFDRYGHFDCMIGKTASKDIFSVVSGFFEDANKHRRVDSTPPPMQFEAPWIGPMLGWVQPAVDKRGKKWWKVRLVLHAPLRRASVDEVVIVPVHTEAGLPVPQADAGCLVPWPARAERYATLDLHFSDASLSKDARKVADTFVIMTVHRDLPLGPFIKFRRKGVRWLMEGQAIGPKQARTLESWIKDPRNADALANARFTLASKVLRGADRGKASPSAKKISFALASCQYPAGLFDAAPAAASYERLLVDAMRPDGPQFLVLCGDQVYVDAAAGLFDPVAAAPDGDVQDSALDGVYEPNWRMQAFRRTTARLPVLTMLDDHEVHDNWKGLTSETDPPREHVRRALAAFHRHQGRLNPERPLAADAASGLGYRCYPGGVPFIVLDTRTARSPRSAVDIARATIIPPEAMKQLQNLLMDKKSADSVKFIVTPSPILPPERFDPQHPSERLRSDTWSGYPASTRALLQFIRDERVRRVVFLSGDAHLSCVCSFEFGAAKAHHQVVSVVSSGMYAPWPFANQRHDELALSGSVDLGLPKSPLEGRMRLHAISTANGYALVNVEKEDADVWLNVSLRAASGATTDCRVKLT